MVDCYGSLTWYLFGSFADTPDVAADIDILVVCMTLEQSSGVRQELASFCVDWPIHLLLMTHDEVTETDFISSQRCVQIYPSLLS